MEVPRTAVRVAEACATVAAAFPLGAREQVLQSALEAELQLAHMTVRREVPVPIVYRSMPLGHDARGREDLVVLENDDYFILELKQSKRLEQKDFAQMFRYMRAREQLGPRVHGVLVLFGETATEVWYARGAYSATGTTFERVRILATEHCEPRVVTHEGFTVA